MDEKYLSLRFGANMTKFEKINENFLKAKCYVMAIGKNANRSHFTKESVNKAYPTLAYVPVVGHLMKNDSTDKHYLGAHDMKLEIENGFNLRSLCVPYGVVLPGIEPIYEDVVEENGTVSEYLVADVILWTGRYPELEEAIYSEDVFFNQSMEIKLINTEPLKADKNYTDVTDFSFNALCMLNKSDDPKFNREPCFPSASIVSSEYENVDNSFNDLMFELKKELSLCFAKDNEKQGGNELTKDEILAKYGKTVADLDFSIDDMSEENLEAKLNELFAENPVAPAEPESPNDDVTNFSATYNEKREIISNAVRANNTCVENGEGVCNTYTWFYLCDFDDNYAYVTRDICDANCDYTTCPGRFSYTIDEEAKTATTSNFEEMIVTWLTLDEKKAVDDERANFEATQKEFEAYKENHTIENAEFEALKQYKEEKEAEENKAAIDAVVTKYEAAIGKTAEFADLKDNIADYTPETLTKECIYIMGLHVADFANSDSKKFSLKFPVEADDDRIEKDEAPYGGIIEDFINKNTNK